MAIVTIVHYHLSASSDRGFIQICFPLVFHAHDPHDVFLPLLLFLVFHCCLLLQLLCSFGFLLIFLFFSSCNLIFPQCTYLLHQCQCLLLFRFHYHRSFLQVSLCFLSLHKSGLRCIG